MPVPLSRRQYYDLFRVGSPITHLPLFFFCFTPLHPFLYFHSFPAFDSLTVQLIQLLFALTAKDVCIDKSCHVGLIKSEFFLSSVFEASKALTHSPPQTLGYERSKSSFTANSRTLMSVIKSAGDFCVSRVQVHNSSPSFRLPTFQLLPLFYLKS